MQFGEVLEQVAEDAMPHVLCTYLYDIASLYMRFYEACPILRSDVEAPIRDSRLRICHAVGRTIKAGLDMLGIEVSDRM